jgi:hypothetical protein
MSRPPRSDAIAVMPSERVADGRHSWAKIGRQMQKPELGKLGISVVFETRPDGGLRVYSNDVPGFMLSHHDAEAVYKDVKPALETIISSMMKTHG